MVEEVELARHAEQRGLILRTLKEDFIAQLTTVRTLLRALDAQGQALSPEGLAFHLTYLELQGYVALIRARDLPDFRPDRWSPGAKSTSILGAKLLPLGLHLLDGKAPVDPSVTF